MIYLAYDGSLNGDWVSRYATRFASHTEERRLTLIHILDQSISKEQLEKKIEYLAAECRTQDVHLITEIHPLDKNVPSSLLRTIPAAVQNVVVCGTRVRSRRHAFLTGTISEKLLRWGRLNVLALRVVQPGVLGNPRDFLVPLSGHPRGFKTAWPFLRLFLPDVESVHLMRVMPVSFLRLPHLSLQQTQSLRGIGLGYLHSVVQEILQQRGTVQFRLDSRVIIGDDWIGEILLQASDLKTRMILLGATEQPLPRRLIRTSQLERLLAQTPCDVGIYRGL
jgi:nucleotide-binding universal stress UspA family protein